MLIKERMLVKKSQHSGAFSDLGLDGETEVVWQSLDNKERGGRYFEIETDGMYLVDDGNSRIGVLSHDRIMNLYRDGIAARCHELLDRYLMGIVPIPDHGTIINVGANIGEIALLLAGNENLSILAVEPDPQTLRVLRENTFSYENIDVVPYALWSRDCQVPFFIDAEAANTSAFTVSPVMEMIEACQLDSIAHEIEEIELIIGDAEGAEPEVLQGATETLAKTRWVSLCCSAERNGETTWYRCEDILGRAGFQIVHSERSKFCVVIARNLELT